MEDYIVERVEGWDARPFSGGVRELHGLADRDFSGAVSAGAWVFMLNGRVIGVFDGAIEDVEDADGTVYEAPDEAVALLSVMQERGGETQAKYYTNDTPLSEADGTLADANFTGYIELSENVMSGDYYVVYYGGRSMSAAYVGASERLVTGDDAFERADDEVGVYEVKKTPVNVTALPEHDDEDETEDESAAGGAAAGGAASRTAAGDDGGGGSSDEESSTETASAADASPAERPDESTAAGRENARERADTATDRSQVAGGEQSTADSGGAAATSAAATDTDSSDSRDASAATNGSGAASDGSLDGEREWQNARSVPTLDPDESTTEASDDDEDAKSRNASSSRSSSKSGRQSSSGQSSRSSGRSSGRQSGSRSKLEKLRQAVKQREEKLTAATDRIENLESERDDLQERVNELRDERDTLQERVDELEEELDAAATPSEPEGVSLSGREALAGTNLFVRYDSKAKPTLDELDGSTDSDAVNDNMRVDHHTTFDAADATVDGEAYEAFLRGTAAFRFVSWAVRALPYEIRDSGHESGLSDLYDALPRVDRAELDGTVEVEPDEETSVSRTFDVVLRDRMGEPLLVADLSTGREPVSGGQMDALVDDASAIREGTDDLAAAMYVTSSFFEPAALETADAETGGGGFLSRSDKESYVKVGRKSGYHLCLVEDRNDAFHLTVPEL
jgi:hypothetical protein